MNEDTDAGRAMIRKEVIRLIVNLSSSVGVKSAEQGLLRYYTSIISVPKRKVILLLLVLFIISFYVPNVAVIVYGTVFSKVFLFVA